ncbi:radical SAM protein [Ruminococcus sp.]|uniref:radical SAM protein n=1 Tax=Ruminococcus sp. TaxID=41978 RepID=UPI001B495AD8|nr:radical SAM protein [Ruminococcus sp.]MBP5433621.1 radical SAM protein [Ruminococcus sp.]
MMISITEKCSMGCSHCMDNAKADGGHMTMETLEAAMDFVIRYNVHQALIITGGEPTEHPEFPLIMGYIMARLHKTGQQCLPTITTNGFWILENEENMKLAKSIATVDPLVKVQWQISTDTRYYPKKLDVTKRIWREPGFVLCKDCVEHMYPQGRAKLNGFKPDVKASKCYNIRAVTKQIPAPTVEKIVWQLAMLRKFCTPSIRIDGGISLGESLLCPKAASIYDSEADIIQKIKDFKCDGCYPLNENLAPLYKQFL